MPGSLSSSVTTCARMKPPARRGGAFKKRLAVSVPDLLDYGQIKAPATQLLMAAAERWAADCGWKPTPSLTAGVPPH